LILASPEYNSGITAALKNAIDWVSRTSAANELHLAAFSGKTAAAILAAFPGGYGGSRGLAQLRPFLENIGISVIAEQVTLPKAHELIHPDGSLIDSTRKRIFSR
jgi:chromate reductase